MKKIPAWALHLPAVLGAVTAVILGIRLARAAGAESIADQYYVQRAAMALADGDAEWVLAQDYYGIYPFQPGLAEIFALIFRVAGSTERLVIQQVQAVCGGITLYVGFRIVRELSGSRAAELLYLVAELLFLPVYCYALFIYGESIGTCSVLCAIWCYLMANRPEGKVWQKGLLWSAVALFMGLAYATRNVLLVVWIAMVIMQILVLLRSKNGRDCRRSAWCRQPCCLGKRLSVTWRKDSLTGNMVPVLRMFCGLPWECRRIPTP